MIKTEKEIEEVKITIYKEFKRKQEENNFLPPWDGTKMLRQFVLDVVSNNPEYQHVNTEILYRDLLLLYYRKEKSSSSKNEESTSSDNTTNSDESDSSQNTTDDSSSNENTNSDSTTETE